MTTALVEPATIPVVPHDLDAEAAVIGSILLNRDAIVAVGAWLEPAFFYGETHRTIYQCMVDLYRDRQPSDFQTVGGLMEDRGLIHLVGDRYGLVDYTNAVPTSFHVEYYAERVYKKAIRRMTIEAGRDVSAQGYTADDDAIFENINAIVRRVGELRQRSGLNLAEQVSAEWREQQDAGGVVSIPTGLLALDRMLVGGLHPGEMTILAARPSVGKSWLALQILYNITQRGGRVLYISYEMPRTDLWSRLAAIESGVTLDRVRSVRLRNDAEHVRTAEADGILGERPIVIKDDYGATMDEIESQAMMHQGQYGDFALIVVDYLQLISTPKGSQRDTNRQNDVSEFSRGVKRMAGTLNCPVLALSQLSRAVEGRAEKVPILSDLRESGSLEQDADTVLFIHREEVYDPHTKRRGIADVHIAKQRNGPLGRVSFDFNPATGRWSDQRGYEVPQGYE